MSSRPPKVLQEFSLTPSDKSQESNEETPEVLRRHRSERIKVSKRATESQIRDTEHLMSEPRDYVTLPKDPDQEKKEAVELELYSAGYREDLLRRSKGIAKAAQLFLEPDSEVAQKAPSSKVSIPRRARRAAQTIDLELIDDPIVKGFLSSSNPTISSKAKLSYSKIKAKVKENVRFIKDEPLREQNTTKFIDKLYGLEQDILEHKDGTPDMMAPKFGDRCKRVIMKQKIDTLDPDFTIRKTYSQQLRLEADSFNANIYAESQNREEKTDEQIRESLKEFHVASRRLKEYESLAIAVSDKLPGRTALVTPEQRRAEVKRFVKGIEDTDSYKERLEAVRHIRAYERCIKSPEKTTDKDFRYIMEREKLLATEIERANNPIKGILRYEHRLCLSTIEKLDPLREKRAQIERAEHEFTADVAPPPPSAVLTPESSHIHVPERRKTKIPLVARAAEEIVLPPLSTPPNLHTKTLQSKSIGKY